VATALVNEAIGSAEEEKSCSDRSVAATDTSEG
jgi:hypothetical protein